MDTLMNLVKAMKDDRGLGFVFVGRGSEVEQLKKQVLSEKLDNTLFFDEIDPTQIPGLYRQCAFGLIALDRRHSTHNIPGKFISYVQAGLPVIAFVNSGNDLVELIAQHRLGQAFIDEDIASLSGRIGMLCEQYQVDTGLADRARALAKDYFAAPSACKTITRSLVDLSL
jgi:hypothetical protein